MSQTFEEKVAEVIHDEFLKYGIKENLVDYGDVYTAYKELAPPNLDYHYFQDSQKPEMAFKPKANSYELINAWWLMQISLLAFAELENAKKRFEKAGFIVEFVENHRTSTQCYVLEKADFIVVVFRGTQVKKVKSSIEDIVTDLMTDGNLDLVASKLEGKVHKGFNKAFLSIWENKLKGGVGLTKLKPILEKLAKNNKPIFFTGHSLGGALATIAANYYLAEIKGKIQGLYTFGSPRVGDQDFVDALRERLSPGKIYRFIHKDDIVTKVPLTDLDLEIYKHVGDVKFINSDNLIEDATDTLTRLGEDIKVIAKNIFAKVDKLIAKVNESINDVGKIAVKSKNTNLRANLISEILITFAPTGIPNHAPIYYAIAITANLNAKGK